MQEVVFHLSCTALVTLLVLSGVQRANAQVYQPPEPYSMWDTWLFQDGDDYHLFFLQSEPNLTWNTIGRAVSKDLLHWTALDPIPTKGPPGAWDAAPTLTGMTVRHAGRYVMFYGSATKGQKIGIMTSRDLKMWKKHPGNPVLEIKAPYSGGDWRDMCTFYDAREKRWHGYVCAQTGGGEGPTIPTIQDKTLVAWVYLANTEQRGGSVLTLDFGAAPGEVFDGIVFGEKAPGKWMAGSDFWTRTQENQSAYPVETADPDTLVQIAITYSGKTVTLYRNGDRYAQYKTGEPTSFGSGSGVVMGLRHLGADRRNAFFAGAIEEARIYSAALDAAAIRALKPNAPSDPKPVAQWTFENGSLEDAMETFPRGELHGGARIVDGKLRLDGKDGYFATPIAGPKACVAHLISTNLIDWEYLPPAFVSGDFVDMEVPDYFELNGRHYLLFSSARSRKDTSGRKNASGTYYVMAEHRDGPYRVPGNTLLLGSGNGRFDNYVGRTIPFETGRLLYHHTAGGPVTWGVPKLVRQNPDGTLWLQYWPGLKGIESRILIENPVSVADWDQDGANVWSVKDGVITGHVGSEHTTRLFLPVEAVDTMVTCTVTLDTAKSAGLLWRSKDRPAPGVLLGEDTAAIERMGHAGAGISTDPVDAYHQSGLGKGPCGVRVLVRAHRAEVYMNDRWILGISLDDVAPAGRLALTVSGGNATFANLRVAELEPLRTK